MPRTKSTLVVITMRVIKIKNIFTPMGISNSLKTAFDVNIRIKKTGIVNQVNGKANSTNEANPKGTKIPMNDADLDRKACSGCTFANEESDEYHSPFKSLILIAPSLSGGNTTSLYSIFSSSIG